MTYFHRLYVEYCLKGIPLDTPPKLKVHRNFHDFLEVTDKRTLFFKSCVFIDELRTLYEFLICVQFR